MKTTDQASDRIIVTNSPNTRWYRVRPALGWTLAGCAAAWLGLCGEVALRGFASLDLRETAARILALNASSVLNVLAAAAVAAVIVESARTSGGRRKRPRKDPRPAAG